MTKRALMWVGMLLLLAPGAVRADDPVEIDAKGSFDNMAPRGGVYPVVVTLHNTGPSADGALIVKSASYSDVLRTYAYPVSLPTGTNKQIIVYPAVGQYADKIDVSFDGSARAKDVALPLLDRDGQQVGMIGDEVGALSALRLTPAQTSAPSSPGYPGGRRAPEARFNDCYAKPEDAPDRAAGYQSVSVLVLGGGAERLRPEQWTALRHWVLDGGSLILTGGAGATYLRVPDAAPLLPVVGVEDVALSALTLPAKVSRQILPGGTVGLVTGTPKPGATILASQGGHVTLARQGLGAGTVLFVGFNPLEAPFRGWAGQHDLWQSLIRQAVATVPAWTLRQWTTQQASFSEYNPGYYSGPGGYGVTARANGVNPFRIKLPPLTTIAWLFLAYFVLVIPVTYIVLKRLKRLEWAWVTSPLLSIAFAYIFYLFTAQLYQAGLSRRTAGVVVAAEGSPDAQFDGFSEMFFPHGGSYRVGIPGTEALEMSPFGGGSDAYGGGYYSSRSSGGTQTQPLETVDGGDVRVPDFQMGNLAFRRLYHTEPVALGGAVTATLTSDAAGRLAGTVRNGTAETLTGCFVYQPSFSAYAQIGDLAPGETKTVRSSGGVGDQLQSSPFAGTASRPDSSGGTQAFLVARTGGEKFGPALGRDVGGAQSVAVLVSLPVAAGGKP